MRVKMLRTTKGAEDGITIKEYHAGTTYDMQEKLAKVFVNALNVAVFVAEEVQQITKGLSAAPENKDAKKDKKDKKDKENKQ
jgi:hypothetical protein